MRIASLNLMNYRNIQNLQMEPCDGINLIYGENAQGKTNILESIWLFTGCKSFRGAKDKELVRFGEKKAKIQLEFSVNGTKNDAAIEIEAKRNAVLNGIELPSPVKMMGEFSAVVFSPAHLSLIKNGPAERRKFLDTALCQLRPAYAAYVAEYSRILNQRNSLLKDIPGHSELLDTLDIWDKRFCGAAKEILKRRKEYCEILNREAAEIYGGLSGGSEKFAIQYVSSFSEENGDLEEQLYRSRKSDLIGGSTSLGPHRDDMEIFINGISARSYGSQGQQRSAALALKTAEGEILKNDTGEYPVVLLDDVMSELDSGRQNYILNHMKHRQVFITCCDPDAIRRAQVGKKFHIADGLLRDKSL